MTALGIGRRLALVTQYFPPEVYPQPLWLAQAMREQGFDVHVCTSIPNYPTGVVLDGYSARRTAREDVDGFRVTRSPVFPSHDSSAVGRIANYLSFAAGASWTGRRILASADASLVWATPATVGGPALVAKLRHGTPYVLYVQDLWPDSVFATQFLTQPTVRRAAEAGLDPYLRLLYRHAAKVVAITPGMRETLVERGIPEEKVGVVYNWVDESVMRPVEPNGRLRAAAGLPAAGGFVMSFAGNVGVAQSLGSWVQAMARLRDLPDTYLVLVGSGSERARLEDQVRRESLDTVRFVDPVPAAEVSEFIADADVAVLSLADVPLFHITLPSKTQAALAQGKAIISSAPGETTDVVRRAGAGWVATPGDPDSIAGAIRAAREAGRAEADRRGASGRDYYRRNMSKSVGSEALVSFLDASRREGSGRS